jgi:NLR family CARD domain-containing protein 3
LGLEHLTIALESTDRLRIVDLSENDLGPKNFQLLLRIFH